MAMVVNHNIAAQLTLVELNKNSDKLRKSLEKVSSGQKINSAKDDASGYVISEKMREQIRTLAQDNQNVQNGSSLFKIADGGINSIVEELRNLKELAINAVNDTNTDIDRVTIQKEFQQKYANINDIATTTNYNGKTLLDGTYRRVFKSVEINPIMIYDDGYNINEDGIYILAQGFTGTVNVNAQNVKIMQEDSTTALNNVTILGPSEGNANLWIENLKIENTADQNVIKFQGNNNVLSVKGENTLSILNNSFTGTAPTNSWGSATINVGEGLTVTGNSSSLNVSNTSSGSYTKTAGSAIGVDKSENSGGNITIGGSLEISVTSEYGSGVGSGYGGTAGDISIGGSVTITATTKYSAAIGGAYNGTVGDITISGNATVTATATDTYGVGVGAGSNGTAGDISIGGSANVTATGGSFGAGIGSSYISNAGNITIGDNSIVTATGGGGAAGIGSGVNNSNVGNITIGDNATVTATGGGGAGIGSGSSRGYTTTSTAGDITIGSSATVNATGGTNAQDIGLGDGTTNNYYARVGTVNLGVAGLSIPDVADVSIPYVEEPGSKEFSDMNPLIIHHGTKANQATNFYINDMHTKSLGTEKLLDSDGFPSSESDLARYDALSYDENLQSAWVETLKSAQNKTLDDISVTTKKNANVAIRVIDGAIEYALNEATQIGSYLQRLEYTDANVTTMGENVQAAESTIRDADMAKEMTEYTKNNVLLQASQSMLAQANQNSSAVLSLLQ